MRKLLESLPLKQGLKLHFGHGNLKFPPSFRVTSIKTRIETGSAGGVGTRPGPLLESLPLKQGLKHPDEIP